MKFFISNKTETGNKFGKWHYFADSKCRITRHGGDMFIYFGYLIDGDLETRIIEVNETKDVLFELTLSSNDKAGSTYRAEKLVID